MANKVTRTKNCPKCGTMMDINRGVCKDCGHMFPWFQVRLYVGGCSVMIALLGLLLMALLSILGVQPPAPPASPAPQGAPETGAPAAPADAPAAETPAPQATPEQ